MKAGRETADFVFAVEHVGLDVDFYHPQGRNLKFAESVVTTFERERENAEIFVQSASDTAFSCDELLSWFLLQTRTTLAQHLPPHTLEDRADDDTNEAREVLLTVPIRFEPGTFYMATEAGDVDVSALKLMCRVTIKRRNG